MIFRVLYYQGQSINTEIWSFPTRVLQIVNGKLYLPIFDGQLPILMRSSSILKIFALSNDCTHEFFNSQMLMLKPLEMTVNMNNQIHQKH